MQNDDVTIEAEDGEGNTASGSEKLKKLREERDAARKEASENLAGWQRAKADYVNLERRLRLAASDAGKMAARGVAMGFIPALDSLEAAAKGNEGLSAILKQADAAMKVHGIVRFSASPGDPFDPARHEAVHTLASAVESEDNTVTEVLQSGYELDGNIVRPARVIVKHYQP